MCICDVSVVHKKPAKKPIINRVHFDISKPSIQLSAGRQETLPISHPAQSRMRYHSSGELEHLKNKEVERLPEQSRLSQMNSRRRRRKGAPVAAEAVSRVVLGSAVGPNPGALRTAAWQSLSAVVLTPRWKSSHEPEDPLQWN